VREGRERGVERAEGRDKETKRESGERVSGREMCRVRARERKRQESSDWGRETERETGERERMRYRETGGERKTGESERDRGEREKVGV